MIRDYGGKYITRGLVRTSYTSPLISHSLQCAYEVPASGASKSYSQRLNTVRYQRPHEFETPECMWLDSLRAVSALYSWPVWTVDSANSKRKAPGYVP